MILFGLIKKTFNMYIVEQQSMHTNRELTKIVDRSDFIVDEIIVVALL